MHCIMLTAGILQIRGFHKSSLCLMLVVPQVTLVVKNPPANAGDARDVDSIPESGRSPGVGNDNLIHYSYLEDSMDRGDWQAIFSPGGCKKLDTTEHTHPHTHKVI